MIRAKNNSTLGKEKSIQFELYYKFKLWKDTLHRGKYYPKDHTESWI